MAWSSAARKLERSRGANGFGPPVISPALRSESIRLRVASIMPIDSSVKRLAVRRDDLGAGFHAAARQRHVRGDDDVAAPGALGDPVVRLVHAGADDDALDKRIARHRDRAVADDEDFERSALERMALGDAINLLLHRAGVGVDVEGDHPARLPRVIAGLDPLNPQTARRQALLLAGRENRYHM